MLGVGFTASLSLLVLAAAVLAILSSLVSDARLRSSRAAGQATHDATASAAEPTGL
jgi:hypothetical protein